MFRFVNVPYPCTILFVECTKMPDRSMTTMGTVMLVVMLPSSNHVRLRFGHPAVHPPLRGVTDLVVEDLSLGTPSRRRRLLLSKMNTRRSMRESYDSFVVVVERPLTPWQFR